jgi:hypothetical protein
MMGTLHGKINQYQKSKDEKRLMAEKKGRKRNSDAALGTIFRIRKCFKRNKGKLNIYFSL